MAFVIKKDYTYIWPVTISEPIDGGDFKQSKVTVKFKDIGKEKVDQHIKNESEGITDTSILDDVLVGWDESAFKDELGNSLPFNDDNLKLVLNVPCIRQSLLKGYFASINGDAIKRKN